MFDLGWRLEVGGILEAVVGGGVIGQLGGQEDGQSNLPVLGGPPAVGGAAGHHHHRYF